MSPGVPVPPGGSPRVPMSLVSPGHRASGDGGDSAVHRGAGGVPTRLHVSPCPLHPQDTGPAVTPGPALCAEARGAAQRLLDHYVQVQGAAVAQMLRKSVETRDWLGTVEPRNVRAVMKRVVEDITAIDVQVRTTPGAQRGWGVS